MALTPRESDQIDLQLGLHHQDPHCTLDIDLAEGIRLTRFQVLPGVLRPMSSAALARFLYRSPEYYAGRTVLDLGCGSGIQGVVCAIRGASEVLFSDINPECATNSHTNISRLALGPSCRVVTGDLFDQVDTKADLLVFAHPYFPGDPIPGDPVSLGMLNPGELVERFMGQARDFVRGAILMPFLEWISPANDPREQGERHGYRVREVYREDLKTGIQRGRLMIYELLP